MKRDKDGNVSTTPVEPHSWTQPKVKLERLGLVEDFAKRPKPVVVLKKLSIDQVQRIIRHSKSGKNRHSSSKSGKSKCEAVYFFTCRLNLPFSLLLLLYFFFTNVLEVDGCRYIFIF